MDCGDKYFKHHESIMTKIPKSVKMDSKLTTSTITLWQDDLRKTIVSPVLLFAQFQVSPLF